MAASNVIATWENDAATIVATLLQRWNSVEAALSAAVAPVTAVATEVATDAASVAAGVAPAVVAPSVISIGGALVQIATPFEDAFKALKGFAEGAFEGKTGAAGAEGAGEAAGAAVRNVVTDVLTGSEVAGPNAANKS